MCQILSYFLKCPTNIYPYESLIAFSYAPAKEVQIDYIYRRVTSPNAYY